MEEEEEEEGKGRETEKETMMTTKKGPHSFPTENAKKEQVAVKSGGSVQLRVHESEDRRKTFYGANAQLKEKAPRTWMQGHRVGEADLPENWKKGDQAGEYEPKSFLDYGALEEVDPPALVSLVSRLQGEKAGPGQYGLFAKVLGVVIGLFAVALCARIAGKR